MDFGGSFTAPNIDADDTSDSTPDYLDDDSDGDGLLDSAEAGVIATVPTFADPDGSVNAPLNDLQNTKLVSIDADYRSNYPPTATADSASVLADTNATIDLTDNITDTENDALITTIDLDPSTPGIQNTLTTADGVWSVDAAGTVSFDPDADFEGTTTIPYTVSDDDGLADDINANTAIDTDGDGSPNHLDLDSDGDGFPDLTEAGGDDADGDGQVDDWSDADADGDGIPDSVDSDLVAGMDSDGDGIVDFADADFANLPDSDGDGIVDQHDSDPLRDGYIPFSGTPITNASLPDTNGNNVSDVYEPPELGAATPEGLIHTGLAGSGCSISDIDQNRDPLLMLFVLFASGWLLQVRFVRRPRPRRGPKENT